MNSLHHGVVTFVLALSVITLPGAAAGSSAEGDSAFARGRFAEARAYDLAPLRGPQDSTRAVRRASLALLHGDPVAARRALEPLGRSLAAVRGAASLLAESHWRRGAHREAADAYRLAGRPAAAARCSALALRPARGPAGPDSTVVPFAQTDPLPVVSLVLPGLGARWFLIDTGAGDLVLDPRVADSLGLLRFGAESGLFGGGRRRAVESSMLDSLGIGDFTVYNVPVGLLDLSRLSVASGGRPVAGILGTRTLMQFRVTLDYAGDRLVLERRGRPARSAPADAVHRPFWLGGEHLVLVHGRMGSGPEALWLLDTGLAGAALAPAASAVLEAGIAPPDTAGAVTGQGGGGAVRVTPFTAPSFRIGAAERAPLLAMHGAFPAALEHRNGYRIAGIVSHAFLRTMRLTLDFDRMQLTLVDTERR